MRSIISGYKKIFFFIIVLINSLYFTIAIAQSDTLAKPGKRDHFVEVTHQAGQVLPTNDFVKGANASGKPIDYYQSFRGEFGWQAKGDREWERLYNLPYFGIGYYVANFFNNDELGVPSALYGFYGGPMKRYRRWSIDYKIGFGLTYNWQPYHPDLNPYNYAIGSYNTVYIDAGILANIRLWERFNLGLGASFTHFSNGATRLPNLGINLFATKVSLRYNFNKERPEIKNWNISEYDDDNEVFIAFSAGAKQIAPDSVFGERGEEVADVSYLMTTISTVYHRQISHKIKLGAGFDVSFDGTAEARYKQHTGDPNAKQYSVGEKMGIGVMGSFEWVIARMSVLIQPGCHVYRKNIEGQTPPMYQRLGLKYHVLPNTFAGIYIKAYNFSVADYIEWTVGHRIKWK